MRVDEKSKTKRMDAWIFWNYEIGGKRTGFAIKQNQKNNNSMNVLLIIMHASGNYIHQRSNGKMCCSWGQTSSVNPVIYEKFSQGEHANSKTDIKLCIIVNNVYENYLNKQSTIQILNHIDSFV